MLQNFSFLFLILFYKNHQHVNFIPNLKIYRNKNINIFFFIHKEQN